MKVFAHRVVAVQISSAAVGFLQDAGKQKHVRLELTVQATVVSAFQKFAKEK
jgi:hypothetical protein